MNKNFYTVLDYNCQSNLQVYIHEKTFPKLYYDSTGKLFWNIVKEFLEDNMNINNTQIENNGYFLTLHKSLNKIYIEDLLENQFNIWKNETFPSLAKIIKTKTDNKIFLSKSIISFYDKFGKEKTLLNIEHLSKYKII
jgi:hypothetical protein